MEAATPAESARTEDRGTKTNNATSRGNVFETNILLASAESCRRNENQHFSPYEKPTLNGVG